MTTRVFNPQREVERLEALRQYEVLDTPPEAAFDRIVQLASTFFGVPIALVSLVEQDRQWFKACYGLDQTQTDRELSFCAHALHTDAVLVVPDATRDPRFANNPLVTGEPGIRFYAGAPLQTPSGHNLGTLCVIDTQPRDPLTSKQETTLKHLAAMVVDELELRQTASALRRSEHHHRALVEQSLDVIFKLSPNGVFTLLNPAFTRMTGYPAEVYLDQSFLPLVHPEDHAKVLTMFRRALEGKSLRFELRLIAQGGETLTTEVVAVPDERDEKTVGVFGFARDISDRAQAEAALVEANTQLERRVEERTAELAALNAQLAHDAFHDALTGLPNRALFMDRLSHAVKREGRKDTLGFAVLFLDLDDFKIVNDSLGHAAGDALLVRVGKRLEACLRPGDTVARLGGDEFAVLLEEVTDTSHLEQIATRIGQAFTPFTLEGHRLQVTPSIGMVSSKAGYTEVEALLRDADIAMYQAKARGKGCHTLFDPAMREQAKTRLTLEAELRTALERDELRVHYQPIVVTQTGELTGFEALVRWQHPKRGTVSPGEFIPLAEETGLIVELDRFVLEEACQQMQAWQQVYGHHLTLSVNLSGQQFTHSDLAKYVRSTLQTTGFKAEQLHLELTESLLIGSSPQATKTLATLRALGVKLHLDDFGTGYSSLSYLQRFSAHTIKIDRSFICNLTESGESATLVRTIILMADALDMQVVAEGVETETQLAYLQALNCDFVQGYLFGKPLPTEEAEAFLLQQTNEPTCVDV